MMNTLVILLAYAAPGVLLALGMGLLLIAKRGGR